MHSTCVPKLTREEMKRRRLAAGRESIESGILKDPPPWGLQARVAAKYGVSRPTVQD